MPDRSRHPSSGITVTIPDDLRPLVARYLAAASVEELRAAQRRVSDADLFENSFRNARKLRALAEEIDGDE